MTDSLTLRVPLTLPVLGRDWSEDKESIFEIVGRQDEARLQLAERNYDDLVVKHASAIGSALRAAGVIGNDSRLVLLGKQVQKIDVLFAEVEVDKKGAEQVRRLVLFEDKLLKNPEQRRQVIAQVLDYARELLSALDEVDGVDDLLGSMKDADRDWLDKHRPDLLRVLRRRKFLHVICGDELDPRLVGLAQHAFDVDDDPMEQQDVALVALEIYRNRQQQLLLVPRVVPIVQGVRRSLELTVIVRDAQRGPLNAVAAVTKQSSESGGPDRDEAAFFEAKFDQSVASDLRDVLRRVRDAGIPGLKEDQMRSGQPTFSIYDQYVLTISPGDCGIVDHIQPATVRLEEGSQLGEALKQYRARLRAIPGAAQRLSGRVVVPAALARQHAEQVVEALRELAQSPAIKT